MFKPGQSGNPGGRSKENTALRDLCRTYTTEAVETLVDIFRDPAQEGNTRVAAIKEVLVRGHGKPAQEIQVSGGEDENGDKLPIAVKGMTDSELVKEVQRILKATK